MIVNIQQVNPPGPQSTGKFGHLVTQAGKIYVPVDMLGEFHEGTTVEVRTKEQTWGATPVLVVAGRPMVPVQGQGGQAGYQRPYQGQSGYRSNTGFQPRVVQGGSRSPEIDQSRHIFVTGVVGRAMGSGKFSASEIPVLTQAANEAYSRWQNPGARPAPPPFDDPLPPTMDDDPGPELQ